MYKLFAFAFFLSISFTMASVFSKAEHSAVLGVDSIYIFLFDVLVYGSFLLYLIFGAIFKLKPKFSFTFEDKPLVQKWLNLILDFTYYLVALFVTAMLFIGFSRFFFNTLISTETIKKLPATFMDMALTDSTYAKSILELASKNSENSRKLDELSYDIAKLDRMLHAPAAERFFQVNDKVITKQTANATFELAFDRYDTTTFDLDNTYKYFFNFCPDSIDTYDPNLDGCLATGAITFWQNEVIQSVTVYEFANDAFESAPVFLVDIVTDQKSVSQLFYPNQKNPTAYYIFYPYQFGISKDTYVQPETILGKPNILGLSLENKDETRNLQFYILADGKISYAEFDADWNPLEMQIE